MEAVFTFIAENGPALGTALLALHGLAVAVVNLTPTPKDDEIVAKAYKFVELLAGVLTKKVKE